MIMQNMSNGAVYKSGSQGAAVGVGRATSSSTVSIRETRSRPRPIQLPPKSSDRRSS